MLPTPMNAMRVIGLSLHADCRLSVALGFRTPVRHWPIGRRVSGANPAHRSDCPGRQACINLEGKLHPERCLPPAGRRYHPCSSVPAGHRLPGGRRVSSNSPLDDFGGRDMTTEQTAYDTILKGGTVIDPATGRNGKFDVGIQAGSIQAIEPALAPAGGAKVVDVSGKLVIAGMIDTHAHVYEHVTGKFGLNADMVGVRSAYSPRPPVSVVIARGCAARGNQTSSPRIPPAPRAGGSAMSRGRSRSRRPRARRGPCSA